MASADSSISASLSSSDAASLTARLRSAVENDERSERSPKAEWRLESPMPSQTPKRRNIMVDEEALTFKPARNPSADMFSWQKAFHNSKNESRWRRKAVLIPAAILLLLIGFVAGRIASGSARTDASAINAHPTQLPLPVNKTSGLQKKLSGGSKSAEQYRLNDVSAYGSETDWDAEMTGTEDDGSVWPDSSVDSSFDTDADFVMEDFGSSDFSGLASVNSLGAGSEGFRRAGSSKAKSKPGNRGDDARAGAGVLGRDPVKFAEEADVEAMLSAKIGTEHVRIYIADLPAKYNTDALQAIFRLGNAQAKPQNAKEAQDASNKVVRNPFGSRLGSQADMLYTSHPHNLDVLFYFLLQDSPLRVSTPEDADAVFVPFWVNKFVKLDQELEKPNRHDLAFGNFWGEVSVNLPYLGKKPHLLIIPGQEESLMSTCGGFGLDFLCHPRARELTIMTPELAVSKAGALFGSEIAPGLISQGYQPGNGSIAIPDLANIHFPQATGGPMDIQGLVKGKTKVASEAFRARAPLRKLLKSQCKQHADSCVHMEPQMLHSTNAGSFSQTVMRNDRSAWFSLHPPGDSAMRTALYNSILAGAIPAVFDRQLDKVLPFPDLMDWSQLLVHVRPETISKSGKDIVNILEEISEEERASVLAALHTVKPLLQYSVAPADLLVRFDSLKQVTRHDDAFTMALKAAFRKACAGAWAPRKCTSL